MKFRKIKKSNISIQTFFFILMSIFMILIIIYGFKKITFVNDTISEQDRILFQKEIQEGFEYCNDPLNKGSSKTISLKSSLFNSVCVIKKDISEDELSSIIGLDNSDNLRDEIIGLLATLDSDDSYGVIFIKSTISNSNELSNYNIINFIQVSDSKENICSFDTKNSGQVDLKINC